MKLAHTIQWHRMLESNSRKRSRTRLYSYSERPESVNRAIARQIMASCSKRWKLQREIGDYPQFDPNT